MKLKSTYKMASSAIKNCAGSEDQFLVEPIGNDQPTAADDVDFLEPDCPKTWALAEASNCENSTTKGLVEAYFLAVRVSKDYRAPNSSRR